MVNTDPTKCVQKGDSKCNFCDIEESSGVPATPYNCFYTCKDFAYYIDASGKCAECHASCRYCMSTSNRDNCYLCNQTALFTLDTDIPLSNGFLPTSENAQLMTC